MISILSSDILTIKKISWDVAHCCPTVLSQVQLFQSKELQLQVCWTPLAAIQHELESNRHGLDAWFPTRKVVGWKGQHTTTRQHNKRHNILHVSQKLSNDSQNCQFLFVSLHMSTVFSSVFFDFLAFFWLDLSQDWGAAICSAWRLAWLGNSQISAGRVMWLPLTIQTSTAELKMLKHFCIRLNFSPFSQVRNGSKHEFFAHGLFHQLHAAPNILGQNIRRMTGCRNLQAIVHDKYR